MSYMFLKMSKSKDAFNFSITVIAFSEHDFLASKTFKIYKPYKIRVEQAYDSKS